MKLKIFIIFSVLSGIFALTSCEETIEKIKEEQQVETQAVYELSLHQRALKIDSVALHQELSENPDAKIKDEIEKNQKMLTAIDQQLVEINPMPIPVGPYPPGPKPPKPCFLSQCFIKISKIDQILVSERIKDFHLVIKNTEGEIVGEISEPIDSNKKGFDAYLIELEETGQFMMSISKYSEILDQQVHYQLGIQNPKKK